MEDFIPASGNVDESLLEIIAECRTSYDQASGEAKSKLAWTLVYAGLQALRGLVGDDALASAYGNDPNAAGARSEHLLQLASRLSLAGHMFATADNAAQSSIRTAVDEIKAIAAGDEPRLFAQLPSESGEKPRTNAHRMAFHRLKVLRWYAFLLGLGLEKAEAQHLIYEAFKVRWDTFRKWDVIVKRELGDDQFRRSMRQAHPEFRSTFMSYDLDEAKRRMASDGQLYRQEARKSAALKVVTGGKL